MLLAAFALAAYCAMPAAQAATSRHSANSEEMDELSDDGWQLLGAGDSAPGKVTQKSTRTTKQVAASSKTAPAAALSDEAVQIPAQKTAQVAPVTTPAYALAAGESGEAQLLAWAKRAGWTVLWNVQDAWIVPGNKEYGNDFETAVKQVTEDLAANGADVLGDSWRGNHTIIITQNGAAAQ